MEICIRLRISLVVIAFTTPISVSFYIQYNISVIQIVYLCQQGHLTFMLYLNVQQIDIFNNLFNFTTNYLIVSVYHKVLSFSVGP